MVPKSFLLPLIIIVCDSVTASQRHSVTASQHLSPRTPKRNPCLLHGPWCRPPQSHLKRISGRWTSDQVADDVLVETEGEAGNTIYSHLSSMLHQGFIMVYSLYHLYTIYIIVNGDQPNYQCVGDQSSNCIMYRAKRHQIPRDFGTQVF